MLQQLPINGPFGFHAPQNGPALVPVRGVGSGIVLDSDGRILTNNHVIENAETISVQFFDGSTHPAMLVGSDPFSDLAIIKAEGLADVPPIRFGDSDTMRVGDWVVAIGSPQGLDWTVTMGIISAKHRGNVGDGEATGLEDFIQTDAAINPGNSGGPLLNLDGELIGINSMILSQSSGSEGLGFAIPSSIIKNISDSLIRLGKVVRGDLGIKVQDLSPGISEGLSLPAGTQGTVVVQVIPEAPADQAGLKRGDVILRYANTPVPTAVQLKRAMAASLPGETVDLDIVRDGKAMSLPCVVEDQYALMKRVESRPGYKLLGIVVRSIGADEAKNLGLADSTGVVVTQVVPGSPADQANVNVGDIIFKVGNADVTDPSDFRARIGEAAKSGMALLLIHDASTGTVGYLQVPLKR
jgi:serine protease Do